VRRALLLSVIALALVGCSKPLSYYAPTVEVVTVWPRDQRPEELRTRGGIAGLLLPLVPLVPYGTRETQTFQEQILADAAVGHLARTNAFRQVYGPSDPISYRKKAEVRLEVALVRTHDSRITTTFGLGLPGAILWFFGLPQDICKAMVEIELRWHAKGHPSFKTIGRSSERTFYWIYGDSPGGAQERIEEALGQAIDDAIRAGIGELRHQLKRDR
jgi:hypothetical protein